MTTGALLDELAAVGISIRHPRDGENRTACPRCNHSDRDDALAVRICGERAVYKCFRCEWTGAASGRAGNTSRTQRAPLKPPITCRAEGYELARQIWCESVPIEGTLAADYLKRRLCATPRPDADLRFHARLFCAKVGRTLPAIVCRVSTVIGNRGVGIHRIFLDPLGSDRALAKMRLGGSDEAVCIRLFTDDEVTLSIAIAEGVETALAAARFHSPIWSTIDAGGMARFPVIDGIESLQIYADHDDAGIRAASVCAERWRNAARGVSAVAPARPGADMNDAVREAQIA